MILAKLCSVSDTPSQGEALSLIGQDGKCDSHLENAALIERLLFGMRCL